MTDDQGEQWPSVSGFQRDWCDTLANGCKRFNVLGPKKHGKTTALSIGRTIWRLGRNPECKTKIISATDGEASKRGDAIIRNIRDNERVHKVFPHLELESSDPSISRFNVKCRNLSGEPSVQTYGVFSTSEGGMADEIIFDDAIDMRNSVLEPALRPKVGQKVHNSWMPSLLKGGVAINLSNAWATGDFSQSLKNNSEWITWEKPAVMAVCECGHVEGYDPPDEGLPEVKCQMCGKIATVTPLWPEKWSIEELQALKRGMPSSAWGRMYMMNPISAEDCLFDPISLLAACRERSFPGVEHGRYAAGCDIASSKRGAYFVLLTGVEEGDGHKHLIAMKRKRGADINYQANAISEAHAVNNLEDIKVEENGVQKLVIQAYRALNEKPQALPISSYTTTSKSKRHLELGIPGLAGEVERGEWTIWDSEGALQPLVQEAKGYGVEEYFDTIMAWLFLRESFRKRKPKSSAPRQVDKGKFHRTIPPQQFNITKPRM